MYRTTLLGIVCLLGLLHSAAVVHGDELGPPATTLPMHLSQTRLYVPGSTTEVRADNLPFSPQYPLWSDGATKRRWLHIPPGSFIDASQPDAWEFPRGTRLWKEFSQGRRIETRLIQRLQDGTWTYATYVWNEEGTDAQLAPAAGARALPVAGAPLGRYVIPSEPDCRACHEGATAPVLGASALQLSSDRDPLAPHAEPRRAGDADLHTLLARGWLRNLPTALHGRPPRIAASSPVARAALGYLHGNCGHCHNDAASSPPVDLRLSRSATSDEASDGELMRTLLGARPRYRVPGLPASAPLIDAGHPETSVLTARMRSRDSRVQMPPIGTELVDNAALALLERWIHDQSPPEPQP